MKNKNAIIIVNLVTMTRVIGTFLMPFICMNTSSAFLITYIICLLLTDSIDGILARRLKACTVFGSLLDQGADKLLGIVVLTVLAREYPVMLLPIITEILIIVINTRGAMLGAISESSILGKIKTWVLGIASILGFCTVYAYEIIPLFDNTTKIGNYFIGLFSLFIENPAEIMNSLASISVGAGIMVACDYWIKIAADIKKARASGLLIEEVKIKKGKDLLTALFSEEYYQKTKNEPLIKKLGESGKK